MLAPISELETEDAAVARLGLASLEQWPQLLSELKAEVYFQSAGTVIVSHPRDRSERERFSLTLRQKGFARYFSQLEGTELRALEPELADRFDSAVYCPLEGQLDARAVLSALSDRIRSESRYISERVETVESGRVRAGGEYYPFDWVVDARGIDARTEDRSLRAVRGERLTLHAPGVTIGRPVRLLHPRYPLYLVPRPNQMFLIGATVIESDSLEPITVRSTLELLSAAFTLHPALGEASVRESVVGLRAAYPDNHPRLIGAPGLLRLNGLYRHGFLLAPALSEMILHTIGGAALSSSALPFYSEAS